MLAWGKHANSRQKNANSTQKGLRQDFNLEPSCCEGTELTTSSYDDMVWCECYDKKGRLRRLK